MDYKDFLYIPSMLPVNKNKIFGFDLDGTLTTYKNGQNPKFHNKVDPDNWLFLGKIKEKILELNNEYVIFIITNQNNISNNKIKYITNIWNALDRIPHVLIANKKNLYRKPNNYFINVIYNIIGPTFDLLNSKYCGDAVGENDNYQPYRWSNDDSLFAYNCQLQFVRPCDIFEYCKFTPTSDIILMMGMPGSGKTMWSIYLQQNYSYIRLSQDEVGDLKQYKENCKQWLLQGYKIILDATHAKNENRLPWITLANEINKSITIAWCIRDGRHWNKLRNEPISSYAYDGKYGYVANFEEPIGSSIEYLY